MATMEDVIASIQVLTEQNKLLTEQGKALQTRLDDAEQEVLRQRNVSAQSAQVVAALNQLPQTLQAMVKTSDVKRVLVDSKGLGKPSPFDNVEQNFLKWSRKTANYMNSIFKGLSPVLMSAVEEDNVIEWTKFKQHQIEVEDKDLEEMNDQVYHCLVALTDGESFDIVTGVGEGQGLEAWRKLHRRWDPVTAGRSKNLLKAIMNPGKARIEDLMGAIERLEDLMRRYACRRTADGSLAVLNEDIKMACLESLLPDSLEQHVQLNRARLPTYTLLRSEVMLYAETKQAAMAGVMPKVSKPVDDGGQRPMDLDSLHHKGGGRDWKDPKGKGKGKGKDPKGKGKGKDSKGKKGGHSQGGYQKTGKGAADKSHIQCHNCGKYGHYARDCWSPKKEAPKGGGKGDHGGKGGKGPRKWNGNGANSLDEPEGETGPKETACLDLGCLDRDTESIDEIPDPPKPLQEEHNCGSSCQCKIPSRRRRRLKKTATVAMSGLLSATAAATVAEDVETRMEYTTREEEVVVNVHITVTRSQMILMLMMIMAFVVIWISRSFMRPQIAVMDRLPTSPPMQERTIAEQIGEPSSAASASEQPIPSQPLRAGERAPPLILAGSTPSDEDDFGEGGSEVFSIRGVPLTAEECRNLGLQYIIPNRYTKGKGRGGDLSSLEHSKDVASLASEAEETLKMNLDTGAAIHALPTSMGVDNKVTGEYYTTASGEKIQDMGQVKLTLEDERGQSRRLVGNVTNVHKCLASASRMCAGGNQEIWLNSEGGVVFPTGGPIAKGLAREYNKLVKRYGTSSLLPVYQERGVYNVYFKLLSKEKVAPVVQAVDKRKP